MGSLELIEELTDICQRQAEIIKAQAEIIEQFGAQVREEEALAQQNRLEAITAGKRI
jgi:regulator of protease activity HflC (stomatin/prohibitin superfamily)